MAIRIPVSVLEHRFRDIEQRYVLAELPDARWLVGDATDALTGLPEWTVRDSAAARDLLARIQQNGYEPLQPHACPFGLKRALLSKLAELTGLATRFDPRAGAVLAYAKTAPRPKRRDTRTDIWI